MGKTPIQLFQERGPVSADTIKRQAGAGLTGPSTALPYLDQIQQSFGPEHDLSNIGAHLGEEADMAARAMNARAFTAGNRVAFRGKPDLRLAAHEAAHIIQQRAGVSLDQGVGTAGDAYERNAEAVASRVASGQSARDLLPASTGSQERVGVQRYLEATGPQGPGRITDEQKAFVSQDKGGGGQILLATKDLIESANKGLATAGEGGSFVRLKETGFSVAQDKTTLYQVLPKFENPKGNKLFHKEMVEANKPGGKDSEGNKVDWFKMYTDCGRSSRSVMGSRTLAPKALLKIGGLAMETNRALEPGGWTDVVYYAGMLAFLKDQANAKYLKEGVHFDQVINTTEPSDAAYLEGMVKFMTDPANVPYMKERAHYIKFPIWANLSDEACLSGMQTFLNETNVKNMKAETHYHKVGGYSNDKKDFLYLFAQPTDAKHARTLLNALTPEGKRAFWDAFEDRKYSYIFNPPRDLKQAKEFFSSLSKEGQKAFTESVAVKTSKNVFREPKHGQQAKVLFAALSEEGQKAFGATLEINEAANPEVGEGYTMATGSDIPGFTKVDKMTWNFHWAGVVMKAASDNITLENYAITFKETGDPKKDEENIQKASTWVNLNWVFQMYGTKKEGQTFHEQHLKSGTHGSKATTFRVKV
ncbi:MAG: DUF4157 domain-containing protein [Bradymonadales bacterium]|nr:DUF4157 domain-containing protein [Bradymonadales bacterium]